MTWKNTVESLPSVYLVSLRTLKGIQTPRHCPCSTTRWVCSLHWSWMAWKSPIASAVRLPLATPAMIRLRRHLNLDRSLLNLRADELKAGWRRNDPSWKTIPSEFNDGKTVNVYIQDDLTKRRANLAYRARQLKKDKNIWHMGVVLKDNSKRQLQPHQSDQWHPRLIAIWKCYHQSLMWHIGMIVWLLQCPYHAFASLHIYKVPHYGTTTCISSFPQAAPFIKCESRVTLGLYFDLTNILVQPIVMMSVIVFAMKQMEFLFYFPFWALISQPFQTLHCISLSLMFSCAQLCTVTEFMLFCVTLLLIMFYCGPLYLQRMVSWLHNLDICSDFSHGYSQWNGM